MNNVISRWQSLVNDDSFPTVDEANKMMADSKVAFALKRNSFKESILSNLSRLKIASKVNAIWKSTNW